MRSQRHSHPFFTGKLGEALPDAWAAMLKRVDEEQAGVYSPKRGAKDPRACEVAIERWGGFFGPYMDLPNGSWAV